MEENILLPIFLHGKNVKEIMEILQKINKENRKTIIMVTHSTEAAKYSSCTITVSDGIIE